MERKQLVYNSVVCKICKEQLISHHRHDYKVCSCKNRTTVDGGLDYARYGGQDINLVESTLVYADDEFTKVRDHAHWGTRGKNGDQPIKFVKLRDMSDDHLRALRGYLNKSHFFRELVIKEITYREQSEISNQPKSIIIPKQNYVRHFITRISRAFRRRIL